MIRRADGFAHFTTAADWQAKGHSYGGNAPTFHPTQGRAGRGCGILAQGATDQSLNYILSAACSPLYDHFAFNSTLLSTIFTCYNTTGSWTHVRVLFNSDGSISLYRDSVAGATLINLTFATLIATSAPALWRASTWHQVQIAMNISPTLGTFLLKLDGIEVTALTQTSGDLFAGGAQNVTTIIRGGVSGGTVKYSDYVVLDDVIDDAAVQQYTGLQGDLAVYEDVNPVDGDNLEWTRSVAAGTHASYVNQNPQDDDATYVRSDTAGLNECFSSPVVTSGIGTILAVKETYCWRKEDATFGASRPYLRDSADVNHEGDLKAAAETYKFDEYFWEKDQLDGADWTAARVNVTQLGFTDASDEG
jgi:hypothetical protein